MPKKPDGNKQEEKSAPQSSANQTNTEVVNKKPEAKTTKTEKSTQVKAEAKPVE